jgi:hypothetical protein
MHLSLPWRLSTNAAFFVKAFSIRLDATTVFFIGSLHSPRKWEPRFREVENLLHAPMKILQNIEKWRCFVGKPAWSVASGAIITLVSVAANPTHRDKVGTATL